MQQKHQNIPYNLSNLKQSSNRSGYHSANTASNHSAASAYRSHAVKHQASHAKLSAMQSDYNTRSLMFYQAWSALTIVLTVILTAYLFIIQQPHIALIVLVSGALLFVSHKIAYRYFA